ncbi:MAG TPA: type II toxin-antitoxin system HicB family antitoxin [Alphaproteobacteria bacterium]|jgi:predicted RNase H-like HicB family nuclease|nr:type II toxin-antitoxin system HicB family antitoxin [Alphaproteobacteria bacterium]
MKSNILRYNTVIRKEGKDFVAYVPTLGISDFGKTIDEAQNNVKKAIQCHIEGLMKTDFEIPAPDNVDFYIGQANVIAPKDFKFAY